MLPAAGVTILLYAEDINCGFTFPLFLHAEVLFFSRVCVSLPRKAEKLHSSKLFIVCGFQTDRGY